MSRTPARGRATLLALVMLALALAVACGGGGSAPVDPGADHAAAAPTPGADGTAAVGAPAPLPSVAPGDGGSVVPALAARTDALTGAPVPLPTAASADFDEGRLRENVGRFPPLDDPAVVPAAAASWMRGDDLVLGAVRGSESRAYPLFMMTFHHVANDTLAGEPYLVTF